MNFHQPLATPSEGEALEHEFLAIWLDSADVGICVLDGDSRVIMLNRPACKLFRVDGVRVLNKWVRVLLRSVHANQGLIDWLEAPACEGERRVGVGPSGEIQLLLKARPVHSLKGEMFKVISITDITEVMASQQRLEEYRRQWQAINAGLVVVDALAQDMPLVYVNPMFERMTGYTSQEVIGRNCRFLQGNEQDQPGMSAIRSAIRDGSNGYALLRNFRKDGTPFLNELFLSPVRDCKGEIVQFLGIQHIRADVPGQESL